MKSRRRPYLGSALSLLVYATALMLGATAARADAVALSPMVFETGRDNGPADGVFDGILWGNAGLINNNGYSDDRAGVEFALPDLPAGSTINSAVLSLGIQAVEGPRSVQIHGYAGDGAIGLADFAQDGLIGSGSVGPGGTAPMRGGLYLLEFDVTPLLEELWAAGGGFAGFNVRESPANTFGYTVMFTSALTNPVCDCPLKLTIDFTPGVTTVAIDIAPGSARNSINLRSAGVVPVAILSSAGFDAAQQVNPDTVSLAGAKVKVIGKADTASCSAEDVNRDGLDDLVCHVLTAQFMIEPGSTVAVLEAETWDGRRLMGQDSIQIVP